MPIGIDQFENTDALGDLPTSVRILQFLARHEQQAFTRQEIATEIDGTPETVGTNLTRLKERDLVRHREPYWAVTADWDRLRNWLLDRFDDERATQLLDDQDGGGPATESLESTDSMDTDAHRPAAMAFFERVSETLANKVATLYLFGSVARDNETATSDVDVLAVIDDNADYAAVDDRLLDIAYDVQLEYGVSVEVHSMSEHEFTARKERGEPFVSTVVAEGVTRV